MNIKILTSQDYQLWDAFVNSQGTHPFHLTCFKQVIEQTFDFNCYYLYAEKNNEIKAILPLVEMKSFLFGHALISTPFLVYGGPLGETQAALRLLEHAVLLGEDLKVDYIDLRCQQRKLDIGWQQTLYVYFEKRLCATHEENLNQIPRKQRAVIRKSENNELTFRFEDDIEHFYLLYAESLRNLGTPVLQRAYFQQLKEQLGDKCSVLTVFHQQKPLTSVMSFYHQDTVFPYYGGGCLQARAFGANDFMYHQLMKSSTEQGYLYFDYGRSKIDSGSYRFKKHWGFEAQPLHYTIIPIRAKKAPNLNPTNPKYQLMIKMWQKLPLRLSMWLGPMIAGRLG